MSVHLSSRLEEIIRLVPSCARVIDVGTDHALVPIALLDRGVAAHAVGIDKSPLPLGQARVNRHNAQVNTTLDLLCAAGLNIKNLEPSDVVVMAGMGGHTMKEIVQESSWRGTLVIQPNRNGSMLREWLVSNGWVCDLETLIKDGTQFFWTSQWSVSTEDPNSEILPLHREFGFQTWKTSVTVFENWFEREYMRIQQLPVQASIRQRLPLYQQMENILSKSRDLG
jgi:tRNA (adenine22-N1)-methyltransferase